MSVCRFTLSLPCSFFFFFNDTATPEIYPLPLHAALPICPPFHRDCGVPRAVCQFRTPVTDVRAIEVPHGNHAGHGALMGAGIGGTFGLALGLAFAGQTCVAYPGFGGDYCTRSSAAVVPVTTLVGAALGAGLGALFGVGSPAR